MSLIQKINEPSLSLSVIFITWEPSGGKFAAHRKPISKALTHFCVAEILIGTAIVAEFVINIGIMALNIVFCS